MARPPGDQTTRRSEAETEERIGEKDKPLLQGFTGTGSCVIIAVVAAVSLSGFGYLESIVLQVHLWHAGMGNAPDRLAGAAIFPLLQGCLPETPIMGMQPL